MDTDEVQNLPWGGLKGFSGSKAIKAGLEILFPVTLTWLTWL